MARRPRHTQTGQLYEMVSRAKEGIPLPCTEYMKVLIISRLAKALKEGGISLCHYSFTHYKRGPGNRGRQGSKQVEFHFDFSTLGGGTVDVFSLTTLDVEEKGTIELYRGSSLIKTLQIPRGVNNGINIVTIREDKIDRMTVKLRGSGAIDNIRVRATDSE